MNRDDGAGLGVLTQLPHDVAHLLVVEHRDADDVGIGYVGDAVGEARAEFRQRCHRLGAHIEDHDAAGPVYEAFRHRSALVAEADVAELDVLAHRMICPPSTLKI